MKTFYLTIALLGTFSINGIAEAEPNRQPQHVIAIEVEKPPQKNGITNHVQVGERKEIPVEGHVQVGERKVEPVREEVGSRDDTHICADCQRPIAYVRRPYYQGRVPVGHPIPRYSQGVVVYPHVPPPAPVIVQPPRRHYRPHADFSFSWNFFR